VNGGPLLIVEQVEFFSGLEADGLSRSDTDFRAGARIAADAGFPGAHIEDAKAAELDALAFRQGALQRFKDGIDGRLGFVALQTGTLNHLVNNVLFNQGVLPSAAWSGTRLMLEMFSAIVNAAWLP
jgi:hypothetical protein